MSQSSLSEKGIRTLFALLNDELAREGIRGEVYVVGGAVMCLTFHLRPSTRDVDAFFAPPGHLRRAAARVAVDAGVDAGWLNDGVKAFLSDRGRFTGFLELSHLRVMVAEPDYMLAMKCLAMRIGEEFHDLEDVRFLLRLLDVKRLTDAQQILEQYYPLDRFPAKTMYVLEDLLKT